MKMLVIFISVFVSFMSVSVAHADIAGEMSKFMRGEVKIKPYVKFSHNNNHAKFGNNSVDIKIGRARLRTNKLHRRMLQSACVMQTGNIMGCAGDVIRNESQRIYRRQSNRMPRYMPYPRSQNRWSGQRQHNRMYMR